MCSLGVQTRVEADATTARYASHIDGSSMRTMPQNPCELLPNDGYCVW